MASRKSKGCQASVAESLESLLESLPDDMGEQPDAPPPLRKAGAAASCVVRIRRSTSDGLPARAERLLGGAASVALPEARVGKPILPLLDERLLHP